jgi:hypothetical protein
MTMAYKLIHDTQATDDDSHIKVTTDPGISHISNQTA